VSPDRDSDLGGLLARIDVDVDGPVRILRIAGELDLTQVASLEAALADARLEPGAQLEIDLCRVTFADSSAVAWLLMVNRHAEEATSTVLVRVRPGPVERVLSLTGVDGIMPVAVEAPERLRLVPDPAR
jgi:anti-anti-sigma factor